MECEPRDNHDSQRPQIRLSLWHDVLGGFNSYFHGQVRILLDETTMRPKTDSSGPQCVSGSIMSTQMLSLPQTRAAFRLSLQASTTKLSNASSLILFSSMRKSRRYRLTHISRTFSAPLTRDVNTLFRSQTLASKIIYEEMKFLGHQYLVISLKPVIDMVGYVE
uniref:Ras-GAP domain-containing protein n=1 Tax=Parascaris equorum TaxID=6256 RepID=A0A914RU40_PAREQ